MTNINDILQDKIRLYDQENGTELARFVAFLERGKVYEGNENIFFYIGNVGELLQKYGLKGKITIGKIVFNKHHTIVGHELEINDWINAIQNLNNPLAISKYLNRDNSFRIYTTVALDGNVVCLGVDVRLTRVNVKITSIRTAFWREIKKIGHSENEQLIYPEP
jgi:hypothetical protein